MQSEPNAAAPKPGDAPPEFSGQTIFQETNGFEFIDPIRPAIGNARLWFSPRLWRFDFATRRHRLQWRRSPSTLPADMLMPMTTARILFWRPQAEDRRKASGLAFVFWCVAAGFLVVLCQNANGQVVPIEPGIENLPGDFAGNSSVFSPKTIDPAGDRRSSGTAATPPSMVKSSRPSTSLTVPDQLDDLLRYGGTPKSVSELRILERQLQRVASVADRCTVSVQIGPAQGCGVIITASGYVLTAAHVAMRPGKNANITLSDGRVIQATTLGMNRNFDAGLLKIDAGQGSDWPHASLGSSEGLIEGMWCVAMGHPGGYEPNRGPVTRVGRILEARRGSILTDCALIGGDSGGPLFDLAGELIAVHSRIGNDVAENLHVPIDRYDDHWAELATGKSWGYLPGFRPVLGVRGHDGDIVATVVSVRDGSPAENAGIEPGDVIEQFGDTRIGDFSSLRDAVSNTMPGERIDLWVRRNGETRRVRLEIGRAND